MVEGADPKQFFEQAYRTHAGYVFGLCLRFAAGDRAWALDRSHDVFIRLNDHLDRLDLQQDLRPWLHRVAVNECLLDLRRRHRRQRLLGVFGFGRDEAPQGPAEDLALGRDRVALDRALGRLPLQQRMLLSLMYFEGESLTDAARHVGISKGHASKLHKRALEQLAQLQWESR